MLAGLQATLQTMTDPNASGGANIFLSTLVLGFSAANGALLHVCSASSFSEGTEAPRAGYLLLYYPHIVIQWT